MCSTIRIQSTTSIQTEISPQTRDEPPWYFVKWSDLFCLHTGFTFSFQIGPWHNLALFGSCFFQLTKRIELGAEPVDEKKPFHWLVNLGKSVHETKNRRNFKKVNEPRVQIHRRLFPCLINHSYTQILSQHGHLEQYNWGLRCLDVFQSVWGFKCLTNRSMDCH